MVSVCEITLLMDSPQSNRFPPLSDQEQKWAARDQRNYPIIQNSQRPKARDHHQNPYTDLAIDPGYRVIRRPFDLNRRHFLRILSTVVKSGCICLCDFSSAVWTRDCAPVEGRPTVGKYIRGCCCFICWESKIPCLG
ncbi:hypothetical protein AVEN_153310-1 [Araneus ventricosus]|uniref:Uncharacterized protein n=1 Tax=Araneus ventricosus TaxID=182803 RepID=A0A4Y2JTU0_ARAVE|nr:hypothetical protein AVEN_62612-1 [Araneus ventricosus]GBM92899.1 hypothetical protein AVEN_153310-1 [Araneus ventricosus]